MLVLGSSRGLTATIAGLVLAAGLVLWLLGGGLTQPRRLASHHVTSWQDSQQAQKEFKDILTRISLDLQPYQKSGITLEMLESTYCHCQRAGWRFQVVDGKMYAAGETQPFQSRHMAVKKQLLELARIDGHLPDVDIYFASDDHPEAPQLTGRGECRVAGPQMQQTKRVEDGHVLLHPGATFGDWPESRFGTWQEMQQTMSLAAEEAPWGERKARLLFAGAVLGETRRILHDNLQHNASESAGLELRWTDWGRPETLMNVHDFCQWRHLLNLEGNSWSSRLKYLLLCGSTVVHPESVWIEFWYAALKHDHNYVSVPAITRENRGAPLLDVARMLNEDDARAHRLAKAAQLTGLQTLSADNIREYWRQLLRSYARLQAFKPQVHADAIPLYTSYGNPRIVQPRERTCKVCPRV